MRLSSEVSTDPLGSFAGKVLMAVEFAARRRADGGVDVEEESYVVHSH